jgi:hypothetical protein
MDANSESHSIYGHQVAGILLVEASSSGRSDFGSID